jgi:hypothetical protein
MLKYIIQTDLDPETGAQIETQPDKVQEILGKWQALNPIGMYFSPTRHRATFIVDVPNEDSLFEALHAIWIAMKSSPENRFSCVVANQNDS